jgi:membrane protein
MMKTNALVTEVSVFLNSLAPSLIELRKKDPLRMAGATAFFTTFALPPIIFILIQLFGIFIDRREVGRQLMVGVTNTFGTQGASQVRQVLKSIVGFSDKWYVIAIGFLFLIFVSTTLFSVIKSSFNEIWQIAIKEKPGFLFVLRTRMRSFAIIIAAGFLFFADILTESFEVIAADYFDILFQKMGPFFRTAMHEGIGIIIVACWFMVLFRFLADGRPSWKATFVGGLLTGALFTAGKLLLQFLLTGSNIGKLYGASGSVILVLLFVFYSSLILYYGASFIYVYSQKKNLAIMPASKAFPYKIEECDVVEGIGG